MYQDQEVERVRVRMLPQRLETIAIEGTRVVIDGDEVKRPRDGGQSGWLLLTAVRLLVSATITSYECQVLTYIQTPFSNEKDTVVAAIEAAVVHQSSGVGITRRVVISFHTPLRNHQGRDTRHADTRDQQISSDTAGT